MSRKAERKITPYKLNDGRLCCGIWMDFIWGMLMYSIEFQTKESKIKAMQG